MSAPSPNPPSFSSHHPVRHHQPSPHSALSASTPAVAARSASVDASLSSTSVPGTHTSSYHHGSSYATAPSDTPLAHSHHLSASLGAAIHSSSSSASLAHMARLQSHLSQLAPSCSTHLADQNAVPILSTTPHPGSPGLSNLSQAFVTAHDTASRLGLGVPLRVTLTTGNGAAVIQSGVLPDIGSSEDEDGSRSGVMGRNGGDGMMLVGTVIAPGDRLAEARIASWGVEDVARKFQRYMCDGK